jgi:hypothetical protein
MRAVVLQADQSVKVEEVPLPGEPGEGELLVKVQVIGHSECLIYREAGCDSSLIPLFYRYCVNSRSIVSSDFLHLSIFLC